MAFYTCSSCTYYQIRPHHHSSDSLDEIANHTIISSLAVLLNQQCAQKKIPDPSPSLSTLFQWQCPRHLVQSFSFSLCNTCYTDSFCQNQYEHKSHVY